MEKMVGFSNDKDVAVLNKLLGHLDKNKADIRYLLGNRIRDIATLKGILTIDDVCVRITTVGATITLPKSNSTGKIFWIKNTSGGNITIAAAPGQLIEGSPTMVIADKVCRQLIDIQDGQWDAT